MFLPGEAGEIHLAGQWHEKIEKSQPSLN